MITALSYVGVRTPVLADWIGYGPGMLGMQPIDRGGGTLALRMDDQAQRLIVEQASGPRLAYTGWEVPDAAALDAMAARLDAAGVAVTRGTRALADQRHVADLVWADDPFGNRVELVHGPALAPTPFVPGRTISGFRTGALGMGHAVLLVDDVAKGLAFYRDILGFGLSDYAETPFQAYFLHVNQRHHSLALIQNPQPDMHHLMIELFDFDDIGQGYDLAIRDGSVAVTLGRHINDHVTGFYTRTPSGFLVEYGWGGQLIDPGRASGERFDCGYSFWGHERDWLGPEARAEALRLRLDAAAQGMRAPVSVLPGNHVVSSSQCAWWDAQFGTAA
jgi:2,3-dihydroxybiphenyl 1,2-dioxygenase